MTIPWYADPLRNVGGGPHSAQPTAVRVCGLSNSLAPRLAPPPHLVLLCLERLHGKRHRGGCKRRCRCGGTGKCQLGRMRCCVACPVTWLPDLSIYPDRFAPHVKELNPRPLPCYLRPHPSPPEAHVGNSDYTGERMETSDGGAPKGFGAGLEKGRSRVPPGRKEKKEKKRKRMGRCKRCGIKQQASKDLSRRRCDCLNAASPTPDGKRRGKRTKDGAGGRAHRARAGNPGGGRGPDPKATLGGAEVRRGDFDGRQSRRALAIGEAGTRCSSGPLPSCDHARSYHLSECVRFADHHEDGGDDQSDLGGGRQGRSAREKRARLSGNAGAGSGGPRKGKARVDPRGAGP